MAWVTAGTIAVIAGASVGMYSADQQHKQQLRNAKAMGKEANRRYALKTQINKQNISKLESNLLQNQVQLASNTAKGMGSIIAHSGSTITRGNTLKRMKEIYEVKSGEQMSGLNSKANDDKVNILNGILADKIDLEAQQRIAKNSVGDYYTQMLNGLVGGATTGATTYQTLKQ